MATLAGLLQPPDQLSSWTSDTSGHEEKYLFHVVYMTCHVCACLRLETCIVFSMPSCTGTGAKCHQVCFQAHLTSKLFDHYALAQIAQVLGS